MKKNNKLNSKICYLAALVFGMLSYKTYIELYNKSNYVKHFYSAAPSIEVDYTPAILYLIVCIVLIVAGVIYSKKNKKNQDNNDTENN